MVFFDGEQFIGCLFNILRREICVGLAGYGVHLRKVKLNLHCSRPGAPRFRELDHYDPLSMGFQISHRR